MTKTFARFASGLSLLLVCGLGAQSARADPGAVETGKFGDWIVHQSTGEGAKICFTTASPRLKEPAGANRGKVLLYVSAWPKDGVKSEISFRLGYQIKGKSDVAVLVGTDAFNLFGKEDRAYVADPTEELKLLEAMKKGSKLIIKATSEKGTETTDTYSLSGLNQALQTMTQACP